MSIIDSLISVGFKIGQAAWKFSRKQTPRQFAEAGNHIVIAGVCVQCGQVAVSWGDGLVREDDMVCPRRREWAQQCAKAEIARGDCNLHLGK